MYAWCKTCETSFSIYVLLICLMVNIAFVIAIFVAWLVKFRGSVDSRCCVFVYSKHSKNMHTSRGSSVEIL